jgi:hypothetical protein
MLRVALGAATLLLLSPLAAAVESAEEPIRVFHPRLDCSQDALEVQIFERDGGGWVDHPQHPRIFADTCQTEAPGLLLNELRTRCDEPAGHDDWNHWKVGVDVWDVELMARCPEPVPSRRSHFEVDLEILSPTPGQVVASGDLDTRIEGRVKLEGRQPGRWDIVFVLDASRGHRRLDADGRVPMYEAIKALRHWILQERPEDALRVGLVAFSHEASNNGPDWSGAQVENDAPLTGDRQVVLAALDAFATAPPAEPPGFPAALSLALSELADHGRERASRAVVVFIDGRAELPFGKAAGYDPEFRRRMHEAALPAREGRVPVHLLALGGEALEAPELVDQMFAGTPSVWVSLPASRVSARGLTELPFPELESVELHSTSAGEPARELVWEPGGRFSARVRLRDGMNSMRLRALTSTGVAADARLSLELDNTRLKQVLLERERERMQRVRQRGKSVVIEAEER